MPGDTRISGASLQGCSALPSPEAPDNLRRAELKTSIKLEAFNK
jgi:hypothetical protein